MEDKKKSIKKLYGDFKTYSRRHPSKVIIGIGFLLVFYSFLLGDNNMFVRQKYARRVRNLERQLSQAELKFRKDSTQLNWNLVDKTELEHVARTKFNFKKPKEVVFFLVDSTSVTATE